LDDGVAPDMAVIAPMGVVGRVVGSPSRHASRVQLIVDRNAAAGALTERTRSGGMVVGRAGDPPLQMDLVSNLADVKQGDVVVASGVDGIYPKGFAIGHIESVQRGSGLYLAIAVRPSVDFSSLEEVLVVKLPPRAASPEARDSPGGAAK
jgi:rod shape-determining protein MreC